MHRPGAAERDHPVALRIRPGLGDVHARGRRHVVVHHPGDAHRGLGGIEAKLRADAAQRRHRRVLVQLHAPAEEAVRRQVAAHQVGIGHRRVQPARAISSRARHRAGAARADGQQADRVGRGDAAAAGADLDQLDHRECARAGRCRA